MDDKTLVERLHIIRDRYCLMNDEYDNMTEAADTIEAQAEEKKALQSRIEALEAEKLKSLALQDLAYQNGAQQYAAMAAQSPEAAAKWLQNLSRRSDGLRVLNDAKQALESQP